MIELPVDAISVSQKYMNTIRKRRTGKVSSIIFDTFKDLVAIILSLDILY